MRVGDAFGSLGRAAALGCERGRMRRVAGRVLLGAAMALVVVGFVASGGRARASKTNRAAGAELFREKGCEHCHGADGAGTEKGPSLATVGKRMKKDEIERQIREGGKQMPAFGDVLNEDEMRKLVDYLAHKKKAPKAVSGGVA
jgi:mono/diheme cytochrome c family protein